MSAPIDQAGDILNQDVLSRSLAPSAVASQVFLMIVVSTVTVLVFNILRPRNKIIYEPKVKYHIGKPPPRISDSLLGWVAPLIRTKEPELLDKIGLDAVAYLRFNRLLRWLFTSIALVTCAILIPLNVSYNLKEVKPGDRDILTMLTIRDVRGNLLFAHVGVSYIITVLVCIFVWFHWRAMVALRRQWFKSPEYLESFYARTLTCMHVPRKYQSDQGIQAIFESVQVPYPTSAVHIGRRVGKLPELIEYHNTTVREFEQILVRYLKGGRIAKERPTIRIGGWMGCGGVKRDAIEFYTAKLKLTEAAISDYRDHIDNRKAESYGFASMAAVPYAHIVANILKDKHPKGTDVALAPNPKDIIWENMNRSDGAIARKKMIGFLWLAIVCFFNTLPLLMISILANLTLLTAYVPFLARWEKASSTSFNIVSGVLPPAVSGLFGFFLPIVMRWLSKYQGGLTHSRLDRAVVARYFSFLVISQLFVFTLIGVIFSATLQVIKLIGKHRSFGDILKNLDKLPGTINRTYIDQATYWLTWFPLRGFLVVFDLAQILNLVWISFRTRVFGRTPRDIREWTQPPSFQYDIYYTNLVFMGTVALVFAPIAPLVVLLAAIVFWMGSWVYKYQLMFVYISRVETGGRLWNVIINRLLISVVIMQLLMVLTIGLQYKFRSLYWISTLPPIFIILIFKMYINRTFDRAFRYYIPTEDELRLAKVHSERADIRSNKLERRFGHPALHAELFTPMLHAKMMPLLREVYRGKIDETSAKMEEYGGEKMRAQVVPGGIKIAAVDQRDLEYDPQLYQRDRGELDWDARSISTTMLDNASIYPKQFYPPNRTSSPAPGYSPHIPVYDQYPGQPANHSEIFEHTPRDEQPLMQYPPPGTGYFDQRPGSAQGQRQYGSPVHTQSPSMNVPSNRHSLAPSQHTQHPRHSSAGSMQTPPTMYQNVGEGYREAPMHRPQQSREGSYYSAYSNTSNPQQQQQYQPPLPSQYLQQQRHVARPSYDNLNMAGRGAPQGGYR